MARYGRSDAEESRAGALAFSDEVREAIASGSPVVALESTVLAHGLPRPRNLEVGRSMEAIVRARGAVPATIALLDGRPHIGLNDQMLERVATEDGVLKLSTRDLPVAMARGASGATTVAATSYLAARAGIEVFATGGIGGVHRGSPLDVSADLLELQRTRIMVVCSGAKSILDLPATREALESLGVLLLGWRTYRLPAFYSVESTESIDSRVDSASEVAAIWNQQNRLGSTGATVVAVPVPSESALAGDWIDGVIAEALTDAVARGIRGAELTPHLLQAIATTTGGASLDANVALLRNNADVAGEIAVALHSSR